jgi:hypothetical protein
MLNIEISKKLSAGIIVIVAIAFPFFWYQELGPAPLDFKAIAVLVLYIIAISGLVALALGKVGPKLTSEVTDRKVQKTMSDLASRCIPLIIVALVLWSCYTLWSFLHAT